MLLLKTGNTEFEFENLNVIMDNNLFIQMSILNDLRRTAIEKLEDLVLEKYTRNLGKVDISLPSVFDNNFESVNSNYKPISLLLNISNPILLSPFSMSSILAIRRSIRSFLATSIFRCICKI